MGLDSEFRDDMLLVFDLDIVICLLAEVEEAARRRHDAGDLGIRKTIFSGPDAGPTPVELPGKGPKGPWGPDPRSDLQSLPPDLAGCWFCLLYGIFCNRSPDSVTNLRRQVLGLVVGQNSRNGGNRCHKTQGGPSSHARISCKIICKI